MSNFKYQRTFAPRIRRFIPLAALVFGSLSMTAQWLGTGDIYYNSGKVGIGISTPQYLLHLNEAATTGTTQSLLNLHYAPTDNYGSATIQLSAGANSNALAIFEQVSAGGGNLGANQDYYDLNIKQVYSGTSAIGNISLFTGGLNRFTVIGGTGSTGGYVGIGITNPYQPLHVQGAIATTSQFLFKKNDGTGTAGLGMSGSGTFIHLLGDGLLAHSDLGQNLGSSSYRFNNLYIGGTANFDGDVDLTEGKFLTFDGKRAFEYNSTADRFDIGEGVATLLFKPSYGAIFNTQSFTVNNDLTGDNKSLILSQTNGYSPGAGNWIQFVQGSGTSTQNFRMGYITEGRFEFRDQNDNTVLTLENAGNVGIGTDNPEELFEVNTDRSAVRISGRNNIDFNNISSNIYYSGGWQRDDATKGTSTIRFHDDGALSLNTADASSSNYPVERMNINAAGDIGVGTNSPTARFHIADPNANSSTYSLNIHDKIKVRGDGVFYWGLNADQGLLSWDAGKVMVGGMTGQDLALHAGSNEYVRVLRTGNVGIGTVTPGKKLEVNGDIRTSYGSGGTLTLFETDAVRSNRLVAGADQDGAYIQSTYGNGGSSDIRFLTTSIERMRITQDGDIGIGTTDPGNYKLAVEGQIGTRSIKVTTAAWADHVFAPEYKLMDLKETEKFIEENGHLPNVPTAEEVEENGFVLEEMDAKLLEKIEELTLYLIEQQKEIEALKAELQKDKTTR